MIKFEDVEIKYGAFVAIENLNIEINEGEFFTLLGPSGCGKTTTLRSLVGFVDPSKGNIYIDKKRVNDVPIEKRDIGMVFQSYALFPTMNVYDNIAFGLKVQKLDRAEIKEKVNDIAEKVELNKTQLNKKVSELSGGQQQRVAIARALIMRPKILVLDEPLSNLDAKLRNQLRLELKSLQRDFGITTIYVTHDQEEALTISDRIAVFNKGVVEQVGTPKEIYDNSKTEFVTNFIGEINLIPKELINKLNLNLDKNTHAYVRLEKVLTDIKGREDEDYIKLKAKVIRKVFYGNFTRYFYDVEGVKIENIEQQDGTEEHEEGEELTLFINPNCIMQFRGDEND